MRRLATLGSVVAVMALGAVALTGSGAQAGGKYRVDAIFDTAKGIIPGQLVKIAGARAGTVKDVVLTEDYKARIEMEVDSEFRFRSDAQCGIQPEGLISENFVQCEPGTPAGEELVGEGGHPPTVPVQNTSVPVAITDLFNIWQTPVRQRFSLLIATLGIGVAGRGEDLNELLRRASPTLALVRRATRLLNRQRHEISRLIIETDSVIGDLAKRRHRVGGFVDAAARVTKQTADHSTALAQSIRRLPALLDAAEPALAQLDQVVDSGTPILKDLRAAAPSVNRVTTDLVPFSKAARPALASLGDAADVGTKAFKHARPVVAGLRTFAGLTAPISAPLGELVTNLQQRGVVENLLTFVYHAGAATSRYDTRSHILPARFDITGCTLYAETPRGDCNSRYNIGAAGAPAKRTQRPASRKPASPGTGVKPPAIQLPQTKLPGLGKPLPGPLGRVVDTVVGRIPPLDGAGRVAERLLDYLLR